jgi:hypothetical protein
MEEEGKVAFDNGCSMGFNFHCAGKVDLNPYILGLLARI